MIKYFTRNQLDLIKYDDCVLKSLNSRIYGFSWYLDAVCDDWDVLVLGDYIAVMPLPKRNKYGLHYIYQAPWIQQLGVFSTKPIDTILVETFIQKIPKKFKLIDLMLNSSNGYTSKYMTSRDNYVLELENKSYQTLHKEYSKGRKSSVKQAQKFNLRLQLANSADVLIEMFKAIKSKDVQKGELEYLALKKVASKGLELGRIVVYEVYGEDKDLLGGAIFLIDKHRITNLFSVLNNLGREKQAMSFLLDFVIKKYANKSLILDFEGSMIKEIASFYKSFGAKKETYFQYKKRQLI